MAHYILTPMGSHGDVLPFLKIAQGLQARGHGVFLITAASFEPLVRAAGIPCAGIGTEEEFNALMLRADLWQPQKGTELVFRLAGRWSGQVADAVRDAASGLPPEEVRILAPGFCFGARLASEMLGIRLITVHLQPACIVSFHDTPVFLPGLEWICRIPKIAKRIGFALLNPIDHLARPAVRAAAEARGVKVPRKLFKHWWNSPGGVIALFPEWFAAPQPDWPRPLYQHTFLLEDLREQQPLSKELEAFLAAGPALWVFTAGSAMMHAHEFFDTATYVMQRMQLRAVFVSRDRSNLPEKLPPTIFHAPYAPFGPLFSRAEGVVHHGGIGTLAHALAAGVSQLVVPMAHDQPDNANRLRRLGVAEVLRPADFTPYMVCAGITRLRANPRFRESADRCRQAIAGDPKLDALLQQIERW
jgi:rhamnosyltransferase subunit B